tara:strand:- start:7514 stop:7753 length:240 start_codon:yes stop_codon:yes gene_type:complete
MIKDSSKLFKGQILQVDLKEVKDRLPKKLIELLSKDPKGTLIGYKMVDGNQFGFVLELNIGQTQWFFESELSEISDLNE